MPSPLSYITNPVPSPSGGRFSAVLGDISDKVKDLYNKIPNNVKYATLGVITGLGILGVVYFSAKYQSSSKENAPEQTQTQPNTGQSEMSSDFSWSPDVPKVGERVVFTPNSNINSSNVDAELWDIDGKINNGWDMTYGSTSKDNIGKSVNYTYTNPGQYEILHKIVPKGGKSSTGIKYITIEDKVNAPPTTNPNPQQTTKPTTTQPSQSTTNTNTDLSGYEWRFEKNPTNTIYMPLDSHIVDKYEKNGNYTVHFTPTFNGNNIVFGYDTKKQAEIYGANLIIDGKIIQGTSNTGKIEIPVTDAQKIKINNGQATAQFFVGKTNGDVFNVQASAGNIVIDETTQTTSYNNSTSQQNNNTTTLDTNVDYNVNGGNASNTNPINIASAPTLQDYSHPSGRVVKILNNEKQEKSSLFSRIKDYISGNQTSSDNAGESIAVFTAKKSNISPYLIIGDGNGNPVAKLNLEYNPKGDYRVDLNEIVKKTNLNNGSITFVHGSSSYGGLHTKKLDFIV